VYCSLGSSDYSAKKDSVYELVSPLRKLSSHRRHPLRFKCSKKQTALNFILSTIYKPFRVECILMSLLMSLVVLLSLTSAVFAESLSLVSATGKPQAEIRSDHLKYKPSLTARPEVSRTSLAGAEKKPDTGKVTTKVPELLPADENSFAANVSGDSPSLRSISTNRELGPRSRGKRSSDRNGTTLPIRLTAPSTKNATLLESAVTLSKDSLLANGIPSTITVSFQGSGSGMEECSGEWGFQRITYNMEVEFDVVGVNPSQVGDIVSYELSSKIGTIHFYGTAEDHYYGETTILNFDRTQSIDLQNTEGTLEYPTTQCSDIYIGFSVPPSASLPCSVYIQYSGALAIVRNTVNMPYPWNAGVGCLDNNYDVPGTDDFDCCPDDNDIENGIDCDREPGLSSLQLDPIRISNGNKFETEQDLQFNSPFRGNLILRRSYNSRTEEIGPLGYGWTHSYNASLVTDYDSNPDFIKILDETARGVYFENQGADVYEGRFNERSRVEKITNGSTEYVWHRLDRKSYVFNADGQLIRIVDEAGNQQNLAYDALNQLDTVTDVASGRIFTFNHSSGLIQSISGPVTSAVPTGIWVNYSYDANQNLTSVTYADGSGFTYKYEDPNDPHNLTEKRDKVGVNGHFLASWSYDDQDRAISNTTRDGRGGTVDYDTHVGDNKVAVTDEYGEDRLYTYSEESCRKLITDKEGLQSTDSGENIVRIEYNDDSRVTLKEYANGRTDQFQDFDSNGNAQTEILAAGTPEERVVTYTYSQYNLILARAEPSVLGPGNKETIWDYDDDYDGIPNENPTTLLSRKIEKGYTHDSSGSVVPYEYITTYHYQPVINPNDPIGLLSSVDGPRPGNGDMTTYTYHPTTGDLESITQPEIGTTTYGNYDAAGNVGSMTDVNQVTTTYTYDGCNRLLTTTTNGSLTRSITYTGAGEIDVMTDESGRTLDHDYDETHGRLQNITDPADNYVQYDYDSFGNRIQDYAFGKDDVMRRYQRFDYQGDSTPEHTPGKLWKVINRNHNNTADVEIIYGYDNMGNLQSLVDANGKETTYGYDLFNRLATVTQPGSVVTQYGYDSHGNLTSVLNAKGQETVYTYDDMGRLLATDSPDTGITSQTYDEAGNLLTKTANNGITATHSYDNLNRLTQITYADASQNVAYTYDAYTAGVNYGKGRLTGMSDPSGSYTYTYDVQGNLTSEEKTIDGVTYTTAYTYDGAGRLRGITYPSGRVITYLPDATDIALVATVTSTFDSKTDTLADSIGHQPFGPLAGLTFGNAIELIQTYNLSYLVDTISAGAIQNLNYSIDDAGNITSISNLVDASKNRTFAYDDLYRLKGINGETNYTYDDVGNRLTKTMNGQSDTYHYYVDGTTQTNILDSITGDNPMTFSHDANGNITAIGSMTLEYSPQTNRLTQVTGKGTYTYNANGQRVKKLAGGITTIYHYDINGNLIGETSNNSTQKDYIYLGSIRLAMAVDYAGDLDSDEDIDGGDLAIFVSHFGPGCSGDACDSDFNGDGNVDAADLAVFAASFGHSATEHYYYHNDHLGTPLKISDQNGAVVWATDYKPFGTVVVSTAAITNNFRFPGQYYDDESGLHYNYNRYYDPDIGRYLRADPIDLMGGTNLYVYASSDPVNRIDRRGLRSAPSICDVLDQIAQREGSVPYFNEYGMIPLGEDKFFGGYDPSLEYIAAGNLGEVDAYWLTANYFAPGLYRAVVRGPIQLGYLILELTPVPELIEAYKRKKPIKLRPFSEKMRNVRANLNGWDLAVEAAREGGIESLRERFGCVSICPQ